MLVTLKASFLTKLEWCSQTSYYQFGFKITLVWLYGLVSFRNHLKNSLIITL